MNELDIKPEPKGELTHRELMGYLCNDVDFSDDFPISGTSTFAERVVCSVISGLILLAGMFVFLFIGHKLLR